MTLSIEKHGVPMTPEQQAANEACIAKHRASGPRVMLTCAAQVVPQAVAWLWPDWLPAGKLTLLAGSPGTGKTTIALALASIVTTGGTWPDGSHRHDTGNVLIWSSEDDPADTLVPRLMAAGADLTRVHFVSGSVTDSGEVLPFDPATDVPLLAERLEDMGGADLLIVDPIISAVSGDSHKATDVRRNLQALIDLGMQHGCAVLGISHFRKSSQGTSPMERVNGSQAFVALARMVWVAAKEEGTERRILARAKANIARDDGGASYSVEQEQLAGDYCGIWTSRIAWGAMVEGTARDILSKVETAADTPPDTALLNAASFLRSLLLDGPISVPTIKADAIGAGYTWATIRRAKDYLGVEARKLGMREGWAWALAAEGAHEGVHEDAQTKKRERLREERAPSATTRVYGQQDAPSSGVVCEDAHAPFSERLREDAEHRQLERVASVPGETDGGGDQEEGGL